MKPYNEGQLRTISVFKDYYALVSELHHHMSETMKLILDLHDLKDKQGWEKSDEIYFQSLIYQWESFKVKQQEIKHPLENSTSFDFNQN